MKVIEPSERGVIRFALGTEAEPTWFVWRLWTTRQDVYLTLTGDPEPKVSMHEGLWKVDVGGRRHVLKPIPCVDAPGWTQGVAIVYAQLPTRLPLLPESVAAQVRARKNVRWFPPPAEGHLAEFVVFVADPSLSRDALPPPDLGCQGQQFAIGPLSASEGSQVWLRHLSKPIPADRMGYVEGLRKEAEGMVVDGSAQDLRARGVVMHLSGSSIVAVPLGLESLLFRGKGQPHLR